MGSRLSIWKQDPSVGTGAAGAIWLEPTPAAGPRDQELAVAGMSPVAPDLEGDFLLDPWRDARAFDRVHVFGVSRRVLTMVQRSLKRLGRRGAWRWPWGADTPLMIHPHAGMAANAYYQRSTCSVSFFHFPTGEGTVHTCRSFDIVAHELGHAVLDALRPDLWLFRDIDIGALHESFGDLLAVLGVLAQPDQCEKLILATRGRLGDPSFLSAIGEEFGDGLNLGHGIRDAANRLKRSEVEEEVHAVSQVLTGAFHAALIERFEREFRFQDDDPAHALGRLSRVGLDLLLECVLCLPRPPFELEAVADRMIRSAPDRTWAEALERAFSAREIERKGFSPGTFLKPRRCTCGTPKADR